MTPTDSAIECDTISENDALADAVNRIINRTPEQKQAERDTAMRHIRKGRPLPEGITLNDVLCGQWPGDESDEQIRDALEKLS